MVKYGVANTSVRWTHIWLNYCISTWLYFSLDNFIMWNVIGLYVVPNIFINKVVGND